MISPTLERISVPYREAVDRINREFGAELASKRTRVEDLLGSVDEQELRRALEKVGIDGHRQRLFQLAFRLRSEALNRQKLASVVGSVNPHLRTVSHTLESILREVSAVSVPPGTVESQKKKKILRHLQGMMDGCRALKKEVHGAV